MEPITVKEGFELELHIEELEPKLALNGGETVLPLSLPTIPGGIHRVRPEAPLEFRRYWRKFLCLSYRKKALMSWNAVCLTVPTLPSSCAVNVDEFGA